MDIHGFSQALFDRYVAAYRAGDAEGCAAAFTPNGRVMSPYGPPAHGRDAIADLHREWVAEGSAGKAIKVLEAGGSEGVAWCLAAYSEGTETGDGTSLNILELQPDGSWLISHCSLNETLPESG